MEIKQKAELQRFLLPQLRESLNILALPLAEIKEIIDKELEDNPLLEESEKTPLPSSSNYLNSANPDYRLNRITTKTSLQDILLRQLGMFADTDEEFRTGQEIIGNIDENGYLKTPLEEISQTLGIPVQTAENALKLIRQFEPAGVGARTVPECLLIQLDAANENDPILRKIIACHLENVAKKNYSAIAKALKEPQEKIESYLKRILKLNPKPGRNYSLDEAQHVIPDIIINEKEDELEITVNNEDIPNLSISQMYRDMLKNKDADPQTRQFIAERLLKAQELLRAISKRQATLRSIVELVAQIQQEAIKEGLSQLKPLTFQEVAKQLNMHESTVCRAVMNKYVKAPYGIIALKDFFSSHIHNGNGEAISSNYAKGLIKELILQEDKKHPLSDQDIYGILCQEHNLNASRRTVAKYRQDLKILPSNYRREH